MSTVADQFRVWEAAATVRVEERRVPWLGLETFSHALRSLRRFEQTSTAVADVMRMGWSTRFALRNTPLPPTDPAVGLPAVIAASDRFVREFSGHSAEASVAAVLEAATRLSLEPSPLAELAGEVLSLYGENADGPQLVLVVPRHALIPPVRAWLKQEDLFAAVGHPNQLRDGRVHDAVLLLGHPGQTYRSQYLQPDLVFQTYGWLLTAPPATHVYVALTSDARALNLEQAWLLSDVSHSHSDVRRADAPELGAEDTHDAPTQVVAVRPPDSPPGTATTEASAVILASGHTVYFHDTLEPRPRVVQRDERTGRVVLATPSPAALQRGALLLSVLGTGEADQIATRADHWLRDHQQWNTEKVIAVRAEAALTKKMLANLIRSQDLEKLVLSIAGGPVSRQDARTLISRLHDPCSYAPGTRAAFERLAAKLGVRGLVASFTDLAALHAAHQQAAIQVRAEMATLLTHCWRYSADAIEHAGFSRLRLSIVGDVILAKVIARGDEHVQIPWTRLGLLVNEPNALIEKIPE